MKLSDLPAAFQAIARRQGGAGRPSNQCEKLNLVRGARRRKFGNVPTTVDGIRFDSRREMRRYQSLVMLEHAGVITDMELQPRFPIFVNGVKICTYIADFRYRSALGVVVEDVKSGPTKTSVYRLKKKLVEALFPVKIEEV